MTGNCNGHLHSNVLDEGVTATDKYYMAMIPSQPDANEIGATNAMNQHRREIYNLFNVCKGTNSYHLSLGEVLVSHCSANGYEFYPYPNTVAGNRRYIQAEQAITWIPMHMPYLSVC